MSLREARALAARKRADADLGFVKAPTFSDAYALWKELKRGAIVSYPDERARLEKWVLPYLKAKRLDEITTPMIVALVKPIQAQGKQVTLKRVLAKLKEIFILAQCAGYVRTNPVSDVTSIFKSATVKHRPSVEWQTLTETLAIFKDAPPQIRILFLWSLCSMLRPGENAKIEKKWIESDVLTMPAEVMKKRRLHRVPITPYMADLIDAAQDCSPHPRSKHIFASKRGGHVDSQTLTRWLRKSDLSGELVAHGIRAIGRTYLEDHGYPVDVCRACLAHVSGTAVDRAYMRSDYFDARRKAMEDFSLYVQQCAERAGVTIRPT